MKKIINRIEEEVRAAFSAAGYEPSYGQVKLSDRPDLCEYQSSGALAAAKQYKKPPMDIAARVAEELAGSALFSEASAVAPGFLNLKLESAVLASALEEMRADADLGVEKEAEPRKILIDYGGPNVAKPLHVGHLRSAIIGESLKRLGRRLGNTVIGDAHLGDWGLQMGLIIAAIREQHPELPYFDPEKTDGYPEEAPFSIAELEQIYPAASARSKEDENFRQEALAATHDLQQGRPGYRALWEQMIRVSVADVKKNYARLGVDFDLWNGESDAQASIPGMIENMKESGLAQEDNGALIIDVKEESDTKEVPPCILLKSDGAALYATTDLATLVDRMRDEAPDEVIYVVDKRQEMHFVQVFRAARKAGIVGENTALTFLGFGTMNGKDGKPFKTREGGVMRLERLLDEICAEMQKKIEENRSVRGEDAASTAELVALSAVKYGDLSNQAGKDYIFDVERFTSFEGNTGPYILYTIVRIKSILARYAQEGGTVEEASFLPAANEAEKALALGLARYGEVLPEAWKELAPHRICAYIYEIANRFNHFYHETKILTENNEEQKAAWIALLDLARRVLEDAIGALGFSAPEKM